MSGSSYRTIRAAANEAGCSPRTLYRLAANGTVRLVKLGGRTLVDMHGLRQHLDALPRLVIRAERSTKRS